MGKTLRQAAIRDRCGVLLIAVRSPDGRTDYVPSGDLVLSPGLVVIGIGGPEDIRRLRRSLGDTRA